MDCLLAYSTQKPSISPLVSFHAFDPAGSIMQAVFLFLASLLILSVTLADHPHVRGLKPPKPDPLLELSTAWSNWVYCTNDDDDSIEANNATVVPTYSMRTCADQTLVPEGYYFLAGSGTDLQGQIINRRCNGIPDNVIIVIPVVNIICDKPFFKFCKNLTMEAEVFTVDKKDYEVTTVAKEDNLKEVGDFTCDNALTTDYQGVDNWYFGEWLIIQPLKTGRHTISVRGSIPEYPFTTEVTHKIVVVPAE